MSLVKEHAPDVLLLDVELPDIHGTQVAKEISSEHPNVTIVLISAHYEKIFSEEARFEYIPKVEFSVSRLREVSGSLP
jgi:two-component SAPR family response regulator